PAASSHRLVSVGTARTEILSDRGHRPLSNRPSHPQPNLPVSLLEGPEELVPVGLELFDLGGHLASDLVDGHEKGHLSLTKGVEDLAFPADHTEHRLAVGHQLYLR